MSDGYFPTRSHVPKPTHNLYANGGLPTCPLNPDQLPGAAVLDVKRADGLTMDGHRPTDPACETFTNRGRSSSRD